jgi:cyclase
VQQMASTLPASEHFQLEQVAEGVCAVIALRKGAAHSNAGIVDLGDRTLVFDTYCYVQDPFGVIFNLWEE